MESKKIKKITGSQRAQVGDGFPIRRALPVSGFHNMDPFLLLDHAGPVQIQPTDIPKGVDVHPHRGFETVTIAYQGVIEHRDSGGNQGKIPADGVQWMTAGSGVLHEEKHGKEFSRQGGTMEMIQLWVNLPAKYKMTTPKYQDIMPDDIPEYVLEDGDSKVRVIAGQYQDIEGAARTFSPLYVYDVRLKEGASLNLEFPETHHTGIYTVRGKVFYNGSAGVGEGFFTRFEDTGKKIELEAEKDSILLVLSGAPLHEPIASYGPFVMNTQAEIQQAIHDFRRGAFGQL